MKLRKLTDLQHLPAAAPPGAENPRGDAVTDGKHFSELGRNVGVFGRLRANHAAGREASQALIDLKRKQIQAVAEIASASIEIAKKKTLGAMVSGALADIGSLMVHVNARTAAVDQQLTAGVLAEQVGHVQNRRNCRDTLDELEREGAITAEEKQVLMTLTEARFAADVESSEKRAGASKKAVGGLHALTVTGLERTGGSLND